MPMELNFLRAPRTGQKIKSIVFQRELGYIKRQDMKQYIQEMLELLPDYFYEVPASSTGQYHPQYALGKEGLVRHTKAGVGILVELFRNETIWWNLNDYMDIGIGAFLLHDGLKHGREGQEFTIAEHPTEMVQFLEEHYTEQIPQEDFDVLCGCIESHMGQFNTHPKTKEVILRKPRTELEKLVHLADYLASRKCLEFNFSVKQVFDN
jgi:hypothetical protein